MCTPDSTSLEPDQGNMDTFALVIHPLNPRHDVARKYPLLARALPMPLIHFFSRFWPPVFLSRITGVRSAATGNEVEGWLVACPCTAQQMLRMAPQAAYAKIVQTGRMAHALGARILGLLAFTSVVGDGGVTVAQRLGMPVTTGRSLTVAVAVEALELAARERGIRPESSAVAVVGATGNIGSACARLLAPMVGEVMLIGRRQSRLAELEAVVREAGARAVRISTRVEDIRAAQMVLSATSAAMPVIQPEHLGHGAVVCDVARPPDVSPRVKKERDDVLITSGGVVDVPGAVDFGFDFGLPPGKAYACMAETMVLALEGRHESYSLGKDVQLERVHEITQLARKHGFQLSAIS
jgi:fatty aldehyde-generating acyl-ACP reductase